MFNLRSCIRLIWGFVLPLAYLALPSYGLAQDPNYILTCNETYGCGGLYNGGPRTSLSIRGVHYYPTCGPNTQRPNAPLYTHMEHMTYFDSCGTNSGGWYCIFDEDAPPPTAVGQARLKVCCSNDKAHCHYNGRAVSSPPGPPCHGC